MTVPIPSFAARTWTAVLSAARTIISSSFSRLSPAVVAIKLLLVIPLVLHHASPRTTPNRGEPAKIQVTGLQKSGRRRNEPDRLRSCPVPECTLFWRDGDSVEVNHICPSSQESTVDQGNGNHGEGRADCTGRTGRHCRSGQNCLRQGTAARAPVESGLLRRNRHAHRRRRYLVLPEDADRPTRFGQAVRVHHQARGRSLLSCHTGGKVRNPCG